MVFQRNLHIRVPTQLCESALLPSSSIMISIWYWKMYCICMVIPTKRERDIKQFPLDTSTGLPLLTSPCCPCEWHARVGWHLGQWLWFILCFARLYLRITSPLALQHQWSKQQESTAAPRMGAMSSLHRWQCNSLWGRGVSTTVGSAWTMCWRHRVSPQASVGLGHP